MKMAVFIKNHEEMMDLLPNRKQVNIRLQIESRLCTPQQDVRNSPWKTTEFFMLNLKWRLWVTTRNGKITIELAYLNQISRTSPIKINTRLSICKHGTNETEHTEILPEQTFHRKSGWKFPVKDYIIDAKYLQNETVTMEVQLSAESNTPIKLDNETFLEWHESFKLADVEYKQLKSTNEEFEANNAELTEEVEQMRTTTRELQANNENLNRKVAYYEEEEEHLKMFKEVLQLFKNNCCERFQHEMELNGNVKVHLNMVPIDMKGDDADEQQNKAALQKKVNEYRERIQQLEDEIAKLKQDDLQLNQENYDLKISSERHYDEIGKLKLENSILIQRQVELKTILADQTTRNIATLDQMKTTIDELNNKNNELEEDLKKLQVFQKAVDLFEEKCCNEFKYDMELADNIKVHLSMVLKQDDDHKSNDEKLNYDLLTQWNAQKETELAKLRLEVQELKLHNNS